MSILIKGMKMPVSCGDCKFCIGLADTEWGTCAGCLIDDECREASSKSGCPLVEVPAPHGDLIDADALIARMESDAEQMEEPIAQMFTYAAINDVKRSETVIEAEEGEDE